VLICKEERSRNRLNIQTHPVCTKFRRNPFQKYLSSVKNVKTKMKIEEQLENAVNASQKSCGSEKPSFWGRAETSFLARTR
jgi:hypothetical protein